MQKESTYVHEAMFFVLAYLPLYELLCTSQVCRSLREAVVNGDVLPPRIFVDGPLNRRISDEILMKITQSMTDSGRRLAALVLLNCFKITDDGLLRVIANNPSINKLYIPGCTGISPEGVIKAVQLLTKGNHRLKSLKLNGIYNMNKQHLKTICNLLGKTHDPKNMYHKRRNISGIESEEDPLIDIDECPKCREIRAVFDCPVDSCRGCVVCVRRCEECGVCVEDGDRQEAACLDDLCLDCWLQLPKCSFCNRPYCHEHEEEQCRVPEVCEGFLCMDCNHKFVHNSYLLE